MNTYERREPIKGDIIKAPIQEHIENVPGNDYQSTFYPKRTRFVTVSTPSNNGNFLAKDARGRLFWFNWITDDITVLRRANG